jgi:DNA polymerase-1
MDSTRESAREIGYVETVFGRRLYLPDIKSKNHNVRMYAERTAINAPMQGTAADIIKMAMIAVDEWIGDDTRARMIMQVHDELVFEIHDRYIDDAITAIRSIMQGITSLHVPLLVDVGRGENWAQAH